MEREISSNGVIDHTTNTAGLFFCGGLCEVADIQKKCRQKGVENWAFRLELISASDALPKIIIKHNGKTISLQ